MNCGLSSLNWDCSFSISELFPRLFYHREPTSQKAHWPQSESVLQQLSQTSAGVPVAARKFWIWLSSTWTDKSVVSRESPPPRLREADTHPFPVWPSFSVAVPHPPLCESTAPTLLFFFFFCLASYSCSLASCCTFFHSLGLSWTHLVFFFCVCEKEGCSLTT